MKPVEDYPGVWECSRHDMFARILDDEAAAALNRGDVFPMHDGRQGVIVRHGDERGGGTLVYYRFEE
ncbi:MAG: hypothetical protein IT337_12890 [Thermomicrobiales bacterium]|nr:hypothetical protein [Thermomicrobiales bacterium]